MSKIEITDLNLYYDEFQALKNVNLKIEANRVHRPLRLLKIDAAENP